MFEKNTMTVTELNLYIKQLIDNNSILNRLYIKGEISNFINHRSGHMYMSLKDDGSLIRAVMFKSSAQKLKFLPENGMKVIVHCRVSVFERDGQYQLYIDDMQPDGMGALFIAFEQLKERLRLEGLFGEETKKSLPKIPTRIGVITSPTGAAIRDILNILNRRFPFAEVCIFPVLVQGDGAPPQIVEAIRYFNAENRVDVIIMGRGGGSIEELWAFNDESLARAVYASDIPIISAVGHETDFTISDYVADLRAPTPSAAAELCVPDIGDLMVRINNVITRTYTLLSRQLESLRQRVDMSAQARSLKVPIDLVNNKRQQLDYTVATLSKHIQIQMAVHKQNFHVLASRLDALSPVSVLFRGYAIASTDSGNVVKSVGSVEKGEKLNIKLTDGIIKCGVEEIEADQTRSQ